MSNIKLYLIKYAVLKLGKVGIATVSSKSAKGAQEILQAQGKYNGYTYAMEYPELVHTTDTFTAESIISELDNPAGEKGDRGPQGLKGEKGEKGDPGDPMTWEKMDPEDKMTFKEDAVADVESEIKTKYYPNMSVGMADNLVGRGDVQDAQINFRPSAGADNIADGAARIKAIKGNSVVWNQQLLNSLFTNTKNWSAYNAITTISSDGNKLVANISSEGATIAVFQPLSKRRVVPNHRYLVIADFETSGGTSWGIHMGTTVYENITNTTRAKRALFVTAPATPTDFAIYPILHNGTIGNFAYIYSVQLIDLTQMFGAEVANNITSYEDYLQLKPMNIEDEFEYNEGELIDMKVDALISTSDNAYDYIEGYARVMGGVPYTLTVDNRKDITPEEVYFSKTLPVTTNEENIIYPNADGTYTFPSIGYAKASFQGFEVGKEDTICICLKHTYEKPHPPYQREIKDLSFISEAFPNGMRSAGSAFDEIRFNPTAQRWEKVTRIGVVDLGSFTWRIGATADTSKGVKRIDSEEHLPNMKIPANTSIKANLLCKRYTAASANSVYMNVPMTVGIANNGSIQIYDTEYNANDGSDLIAFKQSLQGVKLYYELAKPIVAPTPLSPNLNLDYPVWDFGTEEAMASVPSAPFRADINYEPNAVDDLRWAISEIRNLRAQLVQMSANVTNLTE